MSRPVLHIARAKPATRRELTKVETVALWHAVTALEYQVRVMPDIAPPLSDECMAEERKHLQDAKRALRKVNALRRQGL